MASSLARDFRYPLEAEARKLLEDGGKRELRGFKAPEVRVSRGRPGAGASISSCGSSSRGYQ